MNVSLRHSRLLLSVTLLLLVTVEAQAKNLSGYLADIRKRSSDALVVEGTNYRKPIAIHSQKLLIPASTMKLITAYLAIERWGLEHRFSTNFYVFNDTLWIKGMGDPSIMSEEILLMKAGLEQHIDLSQIKKIGVDYSFFSDDSLDGRGDSDNPYDAGSAALALNFNTIALKRTKGTMQPAEPQTPLTPLGEKLGVMITRGEKRVSLPGGRVMSARYFAEVFSELVFNKQLPMSEGRIVAVDRPIYVHENSRTLEEVITGMLKYSTNFVANQLFLLLGEKDGACSAAEASRYFHTQMEDKFQWTKFAIHDGAGLSRNNRLSAKQLIDVLEAFRPWAYMLKSRKGLMAKTGTMSGIRTYAGYYRDREQKWRSFALMMNRSTPWQYRYKVADALTR